VNIANLYSLASGQRLNRIHVFEKYYPIPFDKYIIIQPWSKPSKNFSYWNDVLTLLFPILDKNGIKIIQCGQKNEPGLNYCYHTQGLTSFGQLEFLISKSQLVLTSDSVSSHLSGHYNIPLVVLISNNFKNCISPYFGDKTKQIILEPDRTNKNPSFMLDEGPNKQINEIKPEEVARAVCKLLNLEFNYPYKTLYIGPTYVTRLVETIPNQIINIANLGLDSIIVRMDFLFDENVLANQLNICMCSIITNRPINHEILKTFKPKIREVIYLITEEHSVEFVKNLQALAIPFVLLTYLPPEKYTPFKLDYMDLAAIHKKDHLDPQNIEALKFKDLSGLFYKSNKLTLSSGKIYPSKAAWLKDLPAPDFNLTEFPVIDEFDFWNEAEHFSILTKN